MKPLMRLTFSSIVVIATVALTWFTMTFAQDQVGENSAQRPVDKPPTNANLPKVVIVQNAPTTDVPAAIPQFEQGNDQQKNEPARYLSVRSLPAPEISQTPATITIGYPPAGAGLAQSQEDREFEIKSHDLVAKLREMTVETERKALIEEITVLVTNHFKIRQKHRDQELQQLEDQLKKLRSIQEKREAARAEIIAERVNQLVRESQGLNWGIAPYGQQDPRRANFETWNAASNRYIYASEAVPRPGNLTTTVTMPPPAEEVRVFKTSNNEDASQMLKTIEALIGSGPQRPQVSMTTIGNKIVARGRSEGLKAVEEIVRELQEDAKGFKK